MFLKHNLKASFLFISLSVSMASDTKHETYFMKCSFTEYFLQGFIVPQANLCRVVSFRALSSIGTVGLRYRTERPRQAKLFGLLTEPAWPPGSLWGWLYQGSSSRDSAPGAERYKVLIHYTTLFTAQSASRENLWWSFRQPEKVM